VKCFRFKKFVPLSLPIVLSPTVLIGDGTLRWNILTATCRPGSSGGLVTAISNRMVFNQIRMQVVGNLNGCLAQEKPRESQANDHPRGELSHERPNPNVATETHGASRL
jgi:hypothetical protein